MPTCQCGKQVDDWRGARGHVQFTDGDGHGEHGDVPDDWRDALFDEDEDDPDDEQADEDGQQATTDGATDDEAREAVEEQESHSDQSEASESKGRIRRVLTTPLNELIGGNGD